MNPENHVEVMNPVFRQLTIWPSRDNIISRNLDANVDGSLQRGFASKKIGNSRINYTLPGTVLSLRDGWQWTCSSAAIISGLLAGAAGQMIGLVRASPMSSGLSQGVQSFLLIMCYGALIFNINSTIGSFIIIDNLGEMGFRASCRADELDEYTSMGLGTFLTTKDDLLIKFGASNVWKWMVYHWLCTFYLGIVSLIVAVLTYILVQDELAPKVVTSLVVGLTLLPSTYFIFVRPFTHDY